MREDRCWTDVAAENKQLRAALAFLVDRDCRYHGPEIRILLPRPVATEPAPIPADTRAVVREALEACTPILEEGLYPDNPAFDVALNKIRKALTALDEAPAEGETVGYGVIDEDLESPIFAKLYKTSREARENGIFRKSTQRIVRLVAKPGHE